MRIQSRWICSSKNSIGKLHEKAALLFVSLSSKLLQLR
jgi:hypothetical protein